MGVRLTLVAASVTRTGRTQANMSRIWFRGHVDEWNDMISETEQFMILHRVLYVPIQDATRRLRTLDAKRRLECKSLMQRELSR